MDKLSFCRVMIYLRAQVTRVGKDFSIEIFVESVLDHFVDRIILKLLCMLWIRRVKYLWDHHMRLLHRQIDWCVVFSIGYWARIRTCWWHKSCTLAFHHAGRVILRKLKCWYTAIRGWCVFIIERQIARVLRCERTLRLHLWHLLHQRRET